MSDIQTQMPVKVTDGTNTVGITGSSAFKIDLSATGTNSNPVNISGTISVAANQTVTTVPSGTQAVSGTVTNVPSGTQTVAGTVTNVPSGTQAVSGTVTNVPSGTQTVSGTVTIGNEPTVSIASGQTVTIGGTPTVSIAANQTVTIVPSGTQTVTGTIATTVGEANTGIVAVSDMVETVANASTGTISYTVTTGSTLYLKGVMASSSGAPCKVTVDHGSGPTIVAIAFYSASQPYVHFEFPQPIAIAEDEVVNVKIRNDAGAAQDVYASIFGHEVPD